MVVKGKASKEIKKKTEGQDWKVAPASGEKNAVKTVI